jgi:GLPGLI family protein
MKPLFAFYFLLITLKGLSQNMKAEYAVTTNIYYNDESGNKKSAGVLKYDGFFLRNNKKYISYIKPLYLNEYPNGNVQLIGSDNNSLGVNVCLDTCQYLCYVSLDSFIIRNRFQKALDGKISNQVRNFEPNYQKWELLSEIKNIQGLKCQRARWVNSAGTILYDVWFCEDIITDCNFNGLMGLPGLIVEGECIPWNQKFVLLKYTTNIKVDDSVFWPKEFNEPFKHFGTIRKKW